MYRRSGGLNRFWLLVIGLVLLVGAVVIGGIAFGATIPGVTLPDPQAGAVPSGWAPWLSNTWVLLGIIVLGLVLVALSLGWLIAQIPHRDGAKSLRLHEDPRAGTTMLSPSVIARAVENQTETLPGVTGATALIRGTATRPELVLQVTANERSDLAALLRRVNDEVVRDLGIALEVRPHHVGIQLDVSSATRSQSSVTLGKPAVA